MKKADNAARWAWAMTGSGHFLDETISIVRDLANIDLFLSKAAVEVLRMYGKSTALFNNCDIFYDKTASSVPIGAFYKKIYHSVVIAPATSNVVAKFVCGISDDLVSNIFAHAGKTRVPIIVYACDTGPDLVSLAPKGPVRVFPRSIDLENRSDLARFEGVTLVDSTDELSTLIRLRRNELSL